MTIEINTNNVTPSQFLAYVRKMCKRKGIETEIPSAKEFATLKDENMGRFGSDDFWFTKPYAYHSRTKNKYVNFNEICEFTFDDEKTGHGYYYFVNEE